MEEGLAENPAGGDQRESVTKVQKGGAENPTLKW